MELSSHYSLVASRLRRETYFNVPSECLVSNKPILYKDRDPRRDSTVLLMALDRMNYIRKATYDTLRLIKDRNR